jgi:hypothetical protein
MQCKYGCSDVVSYHVDRGKAIWAVEDAFQVRVQMLGCAECVVASCCKITVLLVAYDAVMLLLMYDGCSSMRIFATWMDAGSASRARFQANSL